MQHILGQVRRCVEDYPHDRGRGQGGRGRLRRQGQPADPERLWPGCGTSYPLPFQVEAITLETGHAGHEL